MLRAPQPDILHAATPLRHIAIIRHGLHIAVVVFSLLRPCYILHCRADIHLLLLITTRLVAAYCQFGAATAARYDIGEDIGCC